MESLEISARTVEEAVQKALEHFGVGREEIEVTVLHEGKSGILGIGAENALIRAALISSKTEPSDDVLSMAKEVLETLLGKMGINATVAVNSQAFAAEKEEEPSPIAFDIQGQDLGILIGRRGQTLSALQFLVRMITAQKTKNWAPIIVDVEGYKQHRYESLRSLARHIAERVKTTGTSFKLEPMPAYERRIIHLTLADHPDVTTQSVGEGEARKVMVMLREKN